jgi:D-arginine dehydrogenase
VVDYVVVGAGIAGVSAAYELAAGGSVLLLEREREPAYHTTGRSAAMFLASYGGADVRPLNLASRPLFEEIGTLLTPRPLLWVGDAGRQADLAALTRVDPTLRPLDEAEVRRLCPVLRPEWCAGALLEAGAMEIDVLGLHQYYLGGARRRGIEVRLDAPVRAGHHDGGGWTLQTGAGTVRADVVVNAAGAWADDLATRLGLDPVGLAPLRRTAAVARASGVDPAWPLVSDVAEGFYFRPEGDGVLVSPADETPSEPCDARPDDLDVARALDNVNAATTLGLRSIRTAWAGLRTFAPDRNPVVGPDPAEPSFVWLAGQGGYGIQTAPALARLAAGADPIPPALSPARLRH